MSSHQFSYLGSLLTIPSLCRPARILAVSSDVPVTTCTLEGLHSSTAPFTKSATADGSEAMEAKEQTPTLGPTPPCLKENTPVSVKSDLEFNRLLCQTLSSKDHKRCLHSHWSVCTFYNLVPPRGTHSQVDLNT